VQFVKQFNAPEKAFGEIDAASAAKLIAATADIALILDGDGVIRDVAFGSDDLSQEGYGDWLNKPWSDTVTVESRPKVQALLADASARGVPAWRQVNHPSARGLDVPVLYSAVQIGNSGRVVAVGRDLRAIAALQQRLLDVQQSLERDYSRLRHAETRYRLLFQIASEAVLIVDVATHKIVEANPAAGQLLGSQVTQVVGRAFPGGFDAASTDAIAALLTRTRSTGRSEEVRARLADGSREFLVTASLFRQDSASFFLVRLSPLRGDAPAGIQGDPHSQLHQVMDGLPDGFVITGMDGRILSTNRAFLDLAQLATEQQARGELLERWIGRPGIDMNVLIANLRQHGSIRLFASTLRGELGGSTEIEVTAVAVQSGEPPCLGFILRNAGRRLTAEGRGTHALPRSVEQLTELIGRVPLKDLVRETTDVIERLCIEAALELTRDNRASAAEMLGLSRQSLYVKLRRYGLGDLDSGDAGDPPDAR
jgi:transcriptional regulator PpsR